jgi:hypothetical protein
MAYAVLWANGGRGVHPMAYAVFWAHGGRGVYLRYGVYDHGCSARLGGDAKRAVLEDDGPEGRRGGVAAEGLVQSVGEEGGRKAEDGWKHDVPHLRRGVQPCGGMRGHVGPSPCGGMGMRGHVGACARHGHVGACGAPREGAEGRGGTMWCQVRAAGER